jgi:signal transduction histidine kinase
MTELYLDRMEATLDNQSVQLLRTVLTSAGRMKQLIHDILEFARVSGDSSGENGFADSAAVLESAIQDIEPAIRQNHAKITFGQLPAVRCQEGELVRLFRNLLSNAIKYHGRESPEIHVSASLRDNDCLFCIKDNGIGIDPKYHEQIFEFFSRLHSSSQYEGSGLGLAICKRIVQRHRGHIWVESEVGKGSAFYFTLPKAIAAIGVPRAGEEARRPNESESDTDHSRAAAG